MVGLYRVLFGRDAVSIRFIMKFACQGCGKKYALPDERVESRKNIKIKCRQCSELVVVKQDGELIIEALPEPALKATDAPPSILPSIMPPPGQGLSGLTPPPPVAKRSVSVPPPAVGARSKSDRPPSLLPPPPAPAKLSEDKSEEGAAADSADAASSGFPAPAAGVPAPPKSVPPPLPPSNPPGALSSPAVVAPLAAMSDNPFAADKVAWLSKQNLVVFGAGFVCGFVICWIF
jgi:hypothetical protein